MGGDRSSPMLKAHELNRQIQNNPGDSMRIIKEFYAATVAAGDRETAELVLLIRDMMNTKKPVVPTWFSKAGFVVGAVLLVFFMGIVAASILHYSVPSDGRFPLVVVFALGSAFATWFFGGDAVASGKIPFLGDQNPLAISATGGVAVLIIILTLGYYFYVK
jgi:hypothetical protein